MIYITGDLHGEIERLYSAPLIGDKLTAADYLIVCGDFGFLFYPPGSMPYYEQQAALDEMEKLPYTVLFVDGNHENFHLLHRIPSEKWKGGRVQRLRKNVIHLMRGQVYDIDGVRFFTMGGAYSRDKQARTAGLSWWEEELPSEAEYREAEQNLRYVGHRVDCIITHTAPREVIRNMGKYPDRHDGDLTGFFDWVCQNVTFEKWYFGHWHTNRRLGKRFHALYTDIVLLEIGDGDGK